MIGPVKALYDRDPAGFFYACLAYVLAVVTMPLLPAFFLVEYLYFYGTFSYDIFLPDVFGLGLFATLAAMFMAAMAILQFGVLGFVLVPIMRRKREDGREQSQKPQEHSEEPYEQEEDSQEQAELPSDQEPSDDSEHRTQFWARIQLGYTMTIFLATNSIMNWIMIASLDGSTSEKNSQSLTIYCVVSVLSLSLVGYTSALLSGNHKAIFTSLLILLVLLGMTTISGPQYAAAATGNALAVFGIGGLREVEIKMDELNYYDEIQGRLLLLGPSTATLLVGETCSEILILNRAGITEIRLGRRLKGQDACGEGEANHENAPMDSSSTEQIRP